MKINGVRVNLKFKGTIALATLLLGAITATAATNEGNKETVESKTPQQNTTTEAKKDAPATPQNTGAPTQAANNNTKDDSFVPSESISEDLAVSFPVDI